jgi:hypothetical protein
MDHEDTIYIVNEAKKPPKAGKGIARCPYCSFRDERVTVIAHIASDHPEYVNDKYPAERLMFNHINKTDHGRCQICGADTGWNSKTWKYHRICKKESCKRAYLKRVKERMYKVYKKTSLLDDEEHQKKMLAGRRLSGEYKFSDGGVRSYMGSYERKVLEFYDKVMNVHSDEIVTPGPTIPYKHDGVDRTWITDLYYIPANLVHDIKDGGSNPNTRNMPEYRSKQDAKEKAIIALNEYNYIRLTDNNFAQLLYILAELKASMQDDDPSVSKIIHINEKAISEDFMPGIERGGYIVNVTRNSEFVAQGMCTSDAYDNLVMISHDGINIKDKPSDDDDCEISLYKFEDAEVKKKIKEVYEAYSTGDKKLRASFIYETFIGSPCVSPMDIRFDTRFRRVETYDEKMKSFINERINVIREEFDRLRDPMYETMESINSRIGFLEEASGTRLGIRV